MEDLFTERYKLKDIVLEMEESEQKLTKKDCENLKELINNISKKYKIKEDDIEYIRKKNPLKADDIKIEDGERAAIRYINTADIDRDNEIVLPDGAQVKDFQKSMTVLYAHDYRGLPIGRDLWIKLIEGKGWLVKTVYAKHQQAIDIYNLVKEHFLNTSSIGFIPLEYVTPDKKGWDKVKEKLMSVYGIKEKLIDNCRRIYTKWILLEHSDVPIPSNINALNIAVGKGFIKDAVLLKDIKEEIEIIENKDTGKQELEIEGIDEHGDEKKETIQIDSPKADSSSESKEGKEIKGELLEVKEQNITVNIIGMKEMIDMVEENISLKKRVKELEGMLEIKLKDPPPKEDDEKEEDEGIEIEMEDEDEKKDEGIGLSSEEIKSIINEAIGKNVKGIKEEMSKNINDNFKKAIGKVV